MIFDIVLRRRKGYGGLRAEAERPRPKPRKTAMVGAHLRGARHRAEPRGAAETHPTPAARTQQRMTLSGKPLTLQVAKRNTTVRYVAIHAAYFHIHVLLQALSGASRRQDFESAPLFFCLFGSALSVT